MDYVDIGPTPANESCQQIGTKHYDHQLARRECQVYVDLIRRTLGLEPVGARLVIKSNAHDFGSYLEVVCRFDDNDETAARYAYNCEDKAPQDWDDTARALLNLPTGS